MTYQQCLDFLYSQLPMYQRDGSSAFKKDLTNTKTLCAALKNPEDEFRSIHVAGTNGKGSTCHLIAAILQAEGYKVGLYTSPHYFDFRERIKINGNYITKQAVCGFVQRMEDTIRQIEPSFFELTVAMAFDYFARNKVDFAVIETGLGGRLDSTNIISPLISVITNISYDHQSMLGDSLALIAGEKAGIIKKGVPVVIGEKGEETDAVFTQKALHEQAPLYFAEDLITINHDSWSPNYFTIDVDLSNGDSLDRLQVGLTGHYQLLNVRTVLAALHVLSNSTSLCISEVALRYGASQVVRLTQMQGRWQKLGEKPLIIADSGHNPSGLLLTMQQLQKIEKHRIRIVFGVSKDKTYHEMLSILPKDAIYYWCAADLPRSLPAHDLMHAASKFALCGTGFDSVEIALRTAIRESCADDLVFVGGSSFVVGEVLKLSL